MPYNIYYFIIKPIQINVAAGRTGVTLGSPGARSPVVQSIMTEYKRLLKDLMLRSAEHIPHPQTMALYRVTQDNQNPINIIEIPAAASTPTSPDFSGLTIQMNEPIVYFTASDLNRRPSSQTDRRPEHIMLDAISAAASQEFPESWVRDSRDSIQSSGDFYGLAMPGIPDISSPANASVFSNTRHNWEATNWQALLANDLATAAFHEIAHCKAESRSRSNNPRWRKAINDPSRPASSQYQSIHDIPNVSVLASNGVGRDPTDADYTLMGEHMLCPIQFYRLDQPIGRQCSRNGSIVTLTPR